MAYNVSFYQKSQSSNNIILIKLNDQWIVGSKPNIYDMFTPPIIFIRGQLTTKLPEKEEAEEIEPFGLSLVEVTDRISIQAWDWFGQTPYFEDLTVTEAVVWRP